MEDKKVLTEVYEILKHLSSENFNKIPSNVINLIKENMDKNYIFKYDNSKSLQEQNISRDSVAVLSYINMEYLLNERQRKYIENLHRQNDENLNHKKIVLYNTDILFKNNNIKKNTALVEYTEEKWYMKFIHKIINIFKRKK